MSDTLSKSDAEGVTASFVPSSIPQRMASIDAYRGFVMLLMMAEILHLQHIGDAMANVETFWGAFWRFLTFHQSHVPWTGCSLHDMIQPSFSFIVGVALPFSIASRLARGQSKTWLTLHAFWRAAMLVFLGVFLRSIGAEQTNWTFLDTLAQIGMGYGFLYILGFCSFRAQLGAFVLILVGYWAAFACYPLPNETFDWANAGVTADWEHNAAGFAAHWNKNTNPAAAFDVWFLNLLPQKTPFLNTGGGYATLSFIPTLGTMILGLFAGTILRSERKSLAKIGIFILIGIACLAVSFLLDAAGVCPIVKRIWTPAWVLFSGGCAYLFLAAFFLFLDVLKIRAPFFPLMVVGANSIVAYCIASTPLNSFIKSNLITHFGTAPFACFGELYEPLVFGIILLTIDWLILCWMYRNKIFVRI